MVALSSGQVRDTLATAKAALTHSERSGRTRTGDSQSRQARYLRKAGEETAEGPPALSQDQGQAGPSTSRGSRDPWPQLVVGQSITRASECVGAPAAASLFAAMYCLPTSWIRAKRFHHHRIMCAFTTTRHSKFCGSQPRQNFTTRTRRD